MPASTRPARARILDAAADVLRRDGLVRATTKQIACAAGCSEALLYKYFPDKRAIFLAVLVERSARLDVSTDLAGTATVTENLIELTARLIDFYAANFTMAASIFSSAELLAAHRDAMRQRGVGPTAPSTAVARYLAAEVDLGRVDAATDGDATARLLTGAALHEAFLCAYEGTDVAQPRDLARRLVACLRVN